MGRRRAHRAARMAAGVACVVAGACGGGPAPAPPPQPRLSPEQEARTATADEWRGTTASRVEELFVGRFPGVRVVAAPGGLSIRIRGQASILGPTAPLYIVDGMPIEAPNGLISLNPHDIAKIEILKDVGSTAYYGVRGANGVVIITTKRGGDR